MPIWDSANLDAPHTQRELGGDDIVEKMWGYVAIDSLVQAAETIRELRAEIARMKQERDYEC